MKAELIVLNVPEIMAMLVSTAGRAQPEVDNMEGSASRPDWTWKSASLAVATIHSEPS